MTPTPNKPQDHKSIDPTIEEILYELVFKGSSMVMMGGSPKQVAKSSVFGEATAQIKDLLDKAYEQGYDDRSLEADHEIEEAVLEARIDEVKLLQKRFNVSTVRKKDKLFAGTIDERFIGRIEELSGATEESHTTGEEKV